MGQGFESLKARHLVGIAQLVRAPDCGSGGRGFDSHYSPHFFFRCRMQGTVGVSPSGKARDFDSRIRKVRILPPQPFDPLAQLVEHLTFNQGAWGSSPQWVTISVTLRVWRNGRRGRFRICCQRRMSSSLFTRTIFYAVVAQW